MLDSREILVSNEKLNSKEILDDAKRVFDIELNAVKLVRECLDDRFVEIVRLISECQGKVIITGMGKPGHIACKIAATLSSLGTASFYLHPAEALHGDLGMVSSNDLVLAFSYSGESQEIVRILPNLKLIGATLVAISGNPNSTLVMYSDYSFVFPKFREACFMNLAPSSSTTASLVLGDAFAICAAKLYGFREQNYALFHPAGSLGKKLLVKARDIMHRGDRNAVVKSGTSMKDAIIEMSVKAIGIVNIVNDENELIGVFTDGDLRRMFTREVNVYHLTIDDMMKKSPIFVEEEMLAVEALKLMKLKNISALPVVSENNLVGTVRVNDIVGEGIFL